MVASDVAARGLDVKGVSHVFNYDTPWHPDDYVHRIGRTGRAGAKGRAFTFVTDEDAEAIDNVEKLTGHKIPVFGKGDVRVDLKDSGSSAEQDKPSQAKSAEDKPAGEKPRRARKPRGETDRSRRENPQEAPAKQDAPAEESARVETGEERPAKPRRERATKAAKPASRPAKSQPRDDAAGEGEWNGPCLLYTSPSPRDS